MAGSSRAHAATTRNVTDRQDPGAAVDVVIAAGGLPHGAAGPGGAVAGGEAAAAASLACTMQYQDFTIQDSE